MASQLKAERICSCANTLGEGPLWHPPSQRLYWFDIDRCTLLRADADGTIDGRWTRQAPISAAAIIDDTTLLIAGAEGLIRFDTEAGFEGEPSPLAGEPQGNRSNDGRVGPGGILWLGTMAIDAPETTASGSIYGIGKGEARALHTEIRIPNAICFAPDGRTAYFTDTMTADIMCQDLDPQTGWPVAPPRVFADTRALPGASDGSVVDSAGCVWNARWDGGMVVRFTPDGEIDLTIEVPTPKVTCPAFGGTDLKTLYITTAGGGATDAASGAGDLYAIELDVAGTAERAYQP